jgi:hypothetical protein
VIERLAQIAVAQKLTQQLHILVGGAQILREYSPAHSTGGAVAAAGYPGAA